MNNVVIRIHNADNMTPYSLAKKFSAKVLLESASLLSRGRFSVLLVREAFRVYQNENEIYLRMPHKQFRISSPEFHDILDVQLHFARQFKAQKHPFPVPAGGIGYLSFEFAQFCDTIPFRTKPRLEQPPLAAALFGHIFLICDHYTNLLYALGLNYKECSINLEDALQEVEDRLTDLDFNYMRNREESSKNKIVSDETAIEQQFKQGVRSIRKEIEAGEYYQCVLSRRLEIQTDIAPLEAYRQLRTTSPAPYLFFLDFGNFQFLGASPESHLMVRNGTAQIRPLAGTRRRGADYNEDRALEADLLADTKEKAEHLMLVDLARNDLGRCCSVSSVSVDTYMQVEYFSRVMHIVSSVSGKLLPENTCADMLRASFPAGTVSGAPKIRAIASIDTLEPNMRQFYAGVVGYIEADGNMDTCIAIRSALKYKDRLYLQAGAGIVYDSIPEREYEETSEKLSALMHSFGLQSAGETEQEGVQ